MVIDLGDKLMPVGIYYDNDAEGTILTKIYQRFTFEKKLSKEEVDAIIAQALKEQVFTLKH